MGSDSKKPAPGEFRPIGLGRRLLVILYDMTILVGLLMIASALALPLTGQRIAGQDIPYTLFLLTICFAYVGGFWVRGGQTLGMRAWKVKIISEDGGPVTWKAGLIRFGVGLLSALPLGLGFLAALFNPSRLCWHDRASDTRLTHFHRAKVKQA